jgi:hypothetical protein
MQSSVHSVARIILKGLAPGLAAFAIACAAVQACTICVLTDAQQALFCNNEDWSNPKTRIWFVPSTKHHGCAYVGFDNGWGQGGMNTQGLAFDWVAGFKEKWDRDRKLKSVSGNPAERMLEACASVEEAIAFFQSHWEPSFTYAKILVADRTGASVIIGAKDGQLQTEKMTQSRGFGYRGRLANEMIAQDSRPTVAHAAKILKAAMQEGQYATKYSNVFDLKSGEIYLFRFPDQAEPIKLNLGEELKKEGHFYDIPRLGEEVTEPLQSLKRMKSK